MASIARRPSSGNPASGSAAAPSGSSTGSSQKASIIPQKRPFDAGEDEIKDEDKPLEPGSKWYDTPTEKQILLLASCSEVENIKYYRGIPHPTARDVIMTAMASVEFLEDLDRVGIDTSGMGINWAGRPINIRTRIYHPTNHRESFSKMVSCLERKVKQRDPIQEISADLEAIDRGWGDLDLDGGEDSFPEAHKLYDCAKVMLKEEIWDAGEVQSLWDTCKLAIKELHGAIAFANSVKQDLIDTNSTALSRWTKLKRMDWLLCRYTIRRFDEMLPDHVHELIQEIEDGLSPCSRLLGHALTLELKLEANVEFYPRFN